MLAFLYESLEEDNCQDKLRSEGVRDVQIGESSYVWVEATRSRGETGIEEWGGEIQHLNSSIPLPKPKASPQESDDSCFLVKVDRLKGEKRSHNKQLPKLYFSCKHNIQLPKLYFNILFPTHLILLAYSFNFLIGMLVKK